MLFEKFGQHQPLNRQCERFAREGIEISLSTLADQVGTCAAVLKPLLTLIETHVMAAGRLHGDDTSVPVLAKGKTAIGRIWTYVRDDRPFGGPAPPAALFHYSRDRCGEHAEQHLVRFAGILQADAFAGYNRLYRADRQPDRITETSCWAHARRKLFVLADIAANARRARNASPISPLARIGSSTFDTRSRSSTGAVWWLSPSTHRLMNRLLALSCWPLISPFYVPAPADAS